MFPGLHKGTAKCCGQQCFVVKQQQRRECVCVGLSFSDLIRPLSKCGSLLLCDFSQVFNKNYFIYQFLSKMQIHCYSSVFGV